MREEKAQKIMTILIIITVVLIVIAAVVAATMIYKNNRDENTAKEAMEDFDKALLSGIDKDPGNIDNGTGNYVPEKIKDDKTKKKNRRVKIETYDVVGKIRIPKTKIEYPILYPLEARSLEIGTAMLQTTAGLNKPGNTTILGHNYRNGKFFSNNHQLKKGDKIYIKNIEGDEAEYEVYKGETLLPNDASYMTRDTNGATEISLSTCNDDSSQRYVLYAKRVK
ncbi:MAG: sortase [Clostridium sp.]